MDSSRWCEVEQSDRATRARVWGGLVGPAPSLPSTGEECVTAVRPAWHRPGRGGCGARVERVAPQSGRAEQKICTAPAWSSNLKCYPPLFLLPCFPDPNPVHNTQRMWPPPFSSIFLPPLPTMCQSHRVTETAIRTDAGIWRECRSRGVGHGQKGLWRPLGGEEVIHKAGQGGGNGTGRGKWGRGGTPGGKGNGQRRGNACWGTSVAALKVSARCPAL